MVPLNLPYGTKADRQVAYDLSFVELKENGDPYPLAGENGRDYTPEEMAKLSHGQQGQLEALNSLLTRNKGKNYVIVMVHGWRDNADIGDGMVANLRVYAARVARHLAVRCKVEGRDCDRRVVGVFMGWRGARVDEQKLTRLFGWLGEQWGQLAALPTLFDRKPVSEQIAPSLRSALSAIDHVSDGDKMIVFGHSLGGNMLMTAFHDEIVKQIERHSFKAKLKPPVGNLIVLLSPATEAAKWTEFQRAAWQRIATIRSDEEFPGNDLETGHVFFPLDQPPVLVAVTAALDWPPGGIRPQDCEWKFKPQDAQSHRDLVLAQVDRASNILLNGDDYDHATHDLFPAFKGDLRPLADFLERSAKRMTRAALSALGTEKAAEKAKASKTARTMRLSRPISAAAFNICDDDGSVDLWHKPLHLAFNGLSGTLRNFPFQNRDREQTITIGNLDPPRNMSGDLVNSLSSRRPFGTTHELTTFEDESDPERAQFAQKDSRYCTGPAAGLTGKERPIPYALAIRASPCSCPSSTGWLKRARAQNQYGLGWDAAKLSTGDATQGGRPALRFIHGFQTAGIAVITQGGDPFWNIRAVDAALANHSGIMSPSFICAINQLVMDDPVADPVSELRRP